MENAFVSKVNKIVIDNLPNEKLGVREVAKILGLSKSQLLRRVKSESGKSVSQLIREIRLRESLALLKEEKYTISEIAYDVGFSSPSYFNKCFHDHFGCTPSDYKKIIPNIDINKIDSKKRNRSTIALVSLFILVVVLLFWNVFSFSKSDQKRIVVLPISNYSYDSTMNYLGDSFTDAITLELAKSKQLEVISRTTAMLYKNSDKDLVTIAKTLDVDLILEASFSIDNDSIRVVAQLIKPLPKEEHVWQQAYDQKFNNTIQLTRTISADIALKIDRSIQQSTHNQQTSIDPEAFELYQRGQYLFNQQNTASLRASLGYLQASIAKDPTFAPVYVTLGNAYILLNKIIPNNIDRLDHRNKCRKAINEALELDPYLASAHIAKGNILGKFDWNWEEMKQFAEKGLSIEPNNAQGHIILSNYYLIKGHPEKALKEVHKARALDPLNRRIGYLVGERFILLGKYEEAIEQFEQVLELDPNYGLALDGLGYVHFILGDKPEAVKVWQRLHLAMGNEEFVEYLGNNTFEDSIRFMVEKEKTDNPVYCSNPTVLALATSLINDQEQALNYLDVAFKYRHEDLPLSLLKPHYIKYHSNELFKEFAQNIGVKIGSNLADIQ